MEGRNSKRLRASTRGRRATTPTPAPLMVSIDVSYFPNPQKYAEFLECCATRKVLIERVFDEKFMRSVNFKYLDRIKVGK